MPTFNFKDNDGIDIGNKYVTKEYVMDVYPNLIPSMASPDLWTWGAGTSGALGDGTTTNRSSPGTTVGGGATWTQVSAVNGETAAIKSDGTLWTWGGNNFGQLGTGNTTSRSSPGTTAGGGTNWKQVSAGTITMAAVKTDGTLWTWGYDGYGLLGAGTNNTSRSSPGTTAGGGTNWKQVTIGGTMMAAIKTDGTLWSWGANGSGKLGDGTTTTRSSPVTTAGGGTNWKSVNLSHGSSSVAAVKTDGTLWTWGGNSSGNLGNGNTTNRSSPGTTAGGGTNWVSVNMADQVCMAIKSDGTLWTWGQGFFGCLGTGATTDRSSPGTTAGGGTDWKFVQLNGDGPYNRGAIKTDGTLWTWGRNASGSLGTNDTTDRSSPGTTAGGGTGWKQVSIGETNSAAIAEQGNW